MNRSLLIVTALSFTSRLAFADAQSERDHNIERGNAADAFDTYGMYVAEMSREGTAVSPDDTVNDPSSCTALLSKYADIQADELVRGMHFDQLPGAVNSSGNEYDVPFREMAQLCKRYAELHDLIVQTRGLVPDWSNSRYPVTDDLGEVRPYDGDPDDRPMTDAQTCVDHVGAAIEAGTPADIAVNFEDTERVTLNAVRERCQSIIAWWPGYKAKLIAAEKKALDALYAPYRAVGIKGDRLELFVSEGAPEDGAFYLPGCDRFATDAKTMKKAKKLFVWLTGEYGEVTLRKYTFKGDKYSMQERTFDFKESAYRWCH